VTGSLKRVRAAGLCAALVGAVAGVLLLTGYAAFSMAIEGVGPSDWVAGPWSRGMVGSLGSLLSIYAIAIPCLWMGGVVWGALVT